MVEPIPISAQNGVQFLTFTVIDYIDIFTRKEYKLEIVDSLNYCVDNKGLEIFAWCLMSNHVHLLCRAKKPISLSKIMKDFKSLVAKKIVQSLENESIDSRSKWILNQFNYRENISKGDETYRFWMDGFHPVNIESQKFFEQKLHYIHQNPVRALIVDEEEHYLFSSARDYAGIKGLVKMAAY